MKKKKKQKQEIKTSAASRPLLTKREMEVARLIANEYSHKMIAAELGMKIRTVDTHINHIHLKTRTHNSAGIANYIRSLGKI